MGSVQGTSPHPGIAHLGVGGSCSRRRPPQSSGHGMLRAGSRDRCFPAGSLSLTVASSAEFWAPRRDKGVWCRLCPRGRTQSRHLRRSRSGLLLWPLWVRAGASALRLLVPPTLGKAAALARLLPSCLCNPADAPHSLATSPFGRCTPPRQPWPLKPDRAPQCRDRVSATAQPSINAGPKPHPFRSSGSEASCTSSRTALSADPRHCGNHSYPNITPPPHPSPG